MSIENEVDTSSVILNQTGLIKSEPIDLKAENMGEIKGLFAQMSNSKKSRNDEIERLKKGTTEKKQSDSMFKKLLINQKKQLNTTSISKSTSLAFDERFHKAMSILETREKPASQPKNYLELDNFLRELNSTNNSVKRGAGRGLLAYLPSHWEQPANVVEQPANGVEQPANVVEQQSSNLHSDNKEKAALSKPNIVLNNELTSFKLENLQEFFIFLGNNPHLEIKEINIIGIPYEKDLRNKTFRKLLKMIRYFI